MVYVLGRVTVVCILRESYSGVCLVGELQWCVSCGRVIEVCVLRESYSSVMRESYRAMCLEGEL